MSTDSARQMEPDGGFGIASLKKFVGITWALSA